jgi:NAD(P)-dependent dehydrogenase (short-subunit alcohol dehydrogenase family)
MDRVKDKVAVVTGAGSGIGRATARRLHQEGAQVVLAGRSANVEVAAKELGKRAVAVVADVSVGEDVQGVIDLALSEFGGIDILCNVAGTIADMVPSMETSDADFDAVMDVNVRGVFLTMRAAVPHLLARGGGSIVNVASTGALIGAPSLGAYNASKGAVVAMTRTVAAEYAAQGLRANVVCPGVIQTPMLERGIGDNPEAAEFLKELIPMRRVGDPVEVANGILFLASDEASYVTGIVMPVEGGQTVV